MTSIFDHKDENQFTREPNKMVKELKRFTDTYKAHEKTYMGIREIECLKVQYPLYFCDIQETDLFAGRDKYPPIGFGAQVHNEYGYYILKDELEAMKNHAALLPENRAIIDELSDYWKTENCVYKTRQSYPAKMQEVLDSDKWSTDPVIGAPLYRMSGTHCDYDKLIRLGIPGLKNEISQYQQKLHVHDDAWFLYEGMIQALDLLSEVCLFFAEMAGQQSKTASAGRRDELLKMQYALRHIAYHKPGSFREAIQLMFLYADISGSFNYGRMDEYLGDLYVQDLDAGILDEEEAVRLISNLWYLMDAKGHIWDCRVIAGGKGRRNEKNADKLAIILMEATNRVKGIVPQLTLRFYKGQDPLLYQKALDVIATGNPYPMLYSDDTNIPNVSNAFRISAKEAVNYLPFGCGEYVIYHRSVGTPSGVINLLQALSVVLHKGVNPVSKKKMGLSLEESGDIKTFDDLYRVYQKEVELYVEQLALQEKLEYDFIGKTAPFLYISMLFDDCISRGKPVFDGGVKYLGGTLESYGNTNTSDSLLAIRKLVFEEKKFTLEELVNMLDANFKGYEKERQMMLNVPKYGNDEPEADQMRVDVDRHLCDFTRNMASRVGLHSYLIVIINNSANATMGEHTGASPDGRHAYTYMANANSSTSGADKNGLTAYLNSIVKPDASIHAGSVQNLKFSKELMTTYRDRTEMLLQTYFDKGGTQCMINCLGREDLENAMKEPAKYSNLIVRVGGFSARYIELPREVQLEILDRTMY